jgi:AcrR family transcriptional regulator
VLDFAAGGTQITPMITPLKRPDRRVLRTREALLAAGYALFAERGLHDVSIDQIIDRAGISKQTFYNHFSDKQALARDIYHAIRTEVEAEVEAINRDVADPAQRLARGTCVYVRTALNDPDHIRFIARMLVEEGEVTDSANRGIIGDLSAGLAQGRFVVRTLDTAAAYVLGASEPLLLSVSAHRDKVQAIAMAQEYLTLILRGLSVPALEAELIAAQAANLLIR